MVEGIEQRRNTSLRNHGALAACAMLLAACGSDNPINNFPAPLAAHGVTVSDGEPLNLQQALVNLTPDSPLKESARYALNSSHTSRVRRITDAFDAAEDPSSYSLTLAEYQNGGTFSLIGTAERNTVGRSIYQVNGVRVVQSNTAPDGSVSGSTLPALVAFRSSNPQLWLQRGLNELHDIFDTASGGAETFGLVPRTPPGTAGFSSKAAGEGVGTGVRGGGIVRRTQTHSSYGVWAMQYDELSFGEGADPINDPPDGEPADLADDDSFYYGVFSFGQSLPATGFAIASGSAVYEGATIGYAVRLDADGRPLATGLGADAFFLSGSATVTLNFGTNRADLSLFSITSVAYDETTSADASTRSESWHDVRFRGIPIADNRFRAFNLSGTGNRGSVALGGDEPATENRRLTGSLAGFVDGLFYGSLGTNGTPPESGGSWGVDSTSLRVRAAFGVSDPTFVAGTPPPPVDDGEGDDEGGLRDESPDSALTLQARLAERRFTPEEPTATGARRGFDSSAASRISRTAPGSGETEYGRVHDAVNAPSFVLAGADSGVGDIRIDIGAAARFAEDSSGVVEQLAFSEIGGSISGNANAEQRAVNVDASRAPGTGTGTGVISADSGILHLRRDYMAYGVWALGYDELTDEPTTATDDDGVYVGVFAHGLVTPEGAAFPTTGEPATHTGFTVGYVVPLGADGAPDNELYFLYGNAEVSVDFENDHASVNLTGMRSVPQDNDPSGGVAWHDVNFRSVPLDGVRYGATSIPLGDGGVDATGADVVIGGAAVTGVPAVDTSGTVTGFVDGWFYGPSNTTNGPPETAGTWGLDATGSAIVRGSFGARR